VPRLGRRPGASGSRAAILSAARRHFGEVGYERATIRRIAAGARVDPALVLHYFGSKDGLFSAAMDFPRPEAVIAEVFAAGTHGLGARLAAFFLTLWESEAGASLIGMLRSVHTSEKAAAMMREFISSVLLSRVAPTLSGRDRELRATLAVSHLLGVAVLRYVVKLEPIASTPTPALAKRVGAVIQRYFDAP
jgi:AcrR family transcriptional regulator